MYISKVELNNYKCFKKAEIEFGKITLLTGANSSGKSSLIYSVLGALQSADFPYSYSTNGKYVNLGDFKEIIFNHDVNEEFVLNLEIQTDKENKIKLNTKWGRDYTRKLPKLKELKIEHPFLSIDITNNDKYIAELNYFKEKDPKHKIYSEGLFEKALNKFLKEIETFTDESSGSENKYLKKRNKELRAFYDSSEPMYFSGRNIALLKQSMHSEKNSYLYRFFQEYERILTNLDSKSGYISSFRFQPERTYYETTKGILKVGKNGENYIDQIIEWDAKKSKNLKTLIKKLSSIGLLSNLKPKRFGGGRFEIQVKVNEKGIVSSLTDVGFGISQILPLMVSDIQLGKDSILYSAQPEIHLHPSIQANLANYFVTNVNDENKRYVLETHSEYLINRFRLQIVKGQIPAEDIKVYYISNKPAGSKIHEISFTPKGEIKGAPKEFFETYLMDTMDIAMNV